MQNKSNRTFYQLVAAANQRVKEKDYWGSKLSGNYVKSHFPYDFNKRSVGEFHHRLEAAAFSLSPELSSALIKLCRDSDIRLCITLVAGLNALLYQYMAMDIDVLTIADIDTDIVVGMPILKSEAEIDFINTLLVLQNPINPSLTFKELLIKTRQTVIEAIENQNYPIEILARDLNMPITSSGDFPLLDVALLMENIHDRTYINHVNFNMIFSFTRSESSIHGRLEYNPLLYRETTIKQIINHLSFLFLKVVSNVDIPFYKIDMISEEEKKRLLVDFNDTAREYPRDKTVCELFAEQAERTPGHTAVIGIKPGTENIEPVGAQGSVPVPKDQVSITYSELNEKSNRLVGFLRKRGVEPDSVVAIMMEPSVEMIIGILGILKAGGVYLPIDLDYSQERINYMLKDSNAMLLLTSDELSDVGRGKRYFAPTTCNLHLSLAYVIYTSGSTGSPKGVMVEHRSLTAYTYSFLQEFDLGPGDTVLQQASFSSDDFVEEVYPVLLRGGRLAIPGKDTIPDIARLSEFILKNRVNIVDCSPLLLDRLNQLDYLINLNGIHIFISGGGVLKGEYIDNLLRIGTVYNTYGPTETTVCTTCFKCSEETQGNTPIGKPIANYNVYILDRINRLLPVGVPGELCISGVGVARGYLNRPELTAEKFGQDLLDYQDYHDEKKRNYEKFLRGSRGRFFQKEPPGRLRLYKTGDLARWMPDRNIEFLGRFDDQVKVRGFRIELGEIENRLLMHKKVKDTVVVVKESTRGDQHLCAYIIPSDVDTIQGLEPELWDYLSVELTDYMVPDYIVILEKLPLSPGGKVDRKALPEPDVFSGRNNVPYVPPVNESEKIMVDIWSEVLDLDSGKIGVNDNFFQLGGHSLKAASLVGRIQKEFSVDFSLERLFTTPTIRAICLLIDQTVASRYSSIEPVEEKEYYPVSSAQKRLYFLQQMDEYGHGQGTAYNVPIMYTVEGRIERGRLKSAFRQLIKRHDSLRTSFHKIEEELVQRINDKVDFEIEYCDKKLPIDFIRSFDLSKASLLRVGLIEAGDEKHILIIDIHHIVSDGFSSGVLATEFLAFYSGKHLPNLKLQYKDFSQWQNNLKQDITIKKQQKYWQEQFPGDIPVLDLPFDYTRPLIQSFEGRTINFSIGMEETSALKRAAREEGGTLYMVLLALFNVFLAKLTNQQDIIIGTPIAGRRHADLEKIIGMFVNTLVLRNYPNGGKSFSRFLEEVITRTLEAFENQDYQFEDLVETLVLERDAGRQPLFDVMFVLQEPDQGGSDGVGQTSSGHWDSTTKGDSFESNISKFDLTFYCLESGGQLLSSFQYSTKLFKAATIERFIDYFKNTVSNVIVDRERKLGEIDILSEQEKQQLLFDFINTEAIYPMEKTIVDLFGEQVNKVPYHISLVYEDQQVDYRKLDERADRLADLLVEKGVKPGSIVGIMVERSTEMIVGILGILKAGAAYLPIDPDYPPERIDYMVKDSNAKVLVSELSKVNKVSEETEMVSLSELSKKFPTQLAHLTRPTQLCYVIYTSGTTGSPKGTLIEHRNVVRLMVNDKFFFDFNDRDIWSLFHSYCFDFSIWEMYGALLYGGKLVLISRMAARDTAVFLNLLKEEKVTVLNQTPSAFYRLMEEEVREGNRGLNLRYVIFGGEALSPLKLREWNLKYPGVKLVNMFGITETTVHVTYKEIGEKEIVDNISNIGKPIPMLKTFILDNGLRLVPPGTAGELYVAGAGVARGYLNRPELTAEKFDHDLWDYQDYYDEKRKENYQKFFGGSRGGILQKSPPGRRRQKIYRSGDLARFVRENNGEIEYLGRIDHQVKIRGFRIELGEIESRLLRHDKVKDVFVLAKEDAHGDRYLCAFCVPGDGKGAVMELRGYLSSTLPDYMVPSHFVFLEEIPLTPNGKVDRRALPEPEMESSQTYAAPRDELEKKLVVIWAKVLDRQEHESIGIDDNFFELGGHSLKAAALISKIHKELNVKIPLTEIFMTPTIRGLAEYVKRSDRDKYLSVEPLEKKEYYRLSSAQKRLYFLQNVAPESTGYNMPFFLPLGKYIEVNNLESIIKQLIARHEALRTSFIMLENEPVQRIHSTENIEFEMEYYDLATGDTIRMEEMQNSFIRPFDLSHTPLIRSGLIKLPDGCHIWMVDMHHIIADGTSTVILQQDFSTFYSGDMLPELKIQYKDFSEWQNRLFESGKIKFQEDYWLTLYPDIKKIPRLNVMGDHKRPEVFTFAGDNYAFMLERDDAEKFKVLGTRNGGTLYMNLLAVINTLFYKYTNQTDIIIGGGIAGRPHADLQDIIGMFVNMLGMRNYPKGEKSYQTFLKEVIANSILAFENQDVQFEELVDRLDPDRDPSRNPLFDFTMVVQNFRKSAVRGNDSRSGEGSGQDEELASVGFTNKTSKFDMTFFISESGEDVYTAIEYYTGIFEKETIQRLASHFKKIIKAVIKDPSIKLKDIEIISEEEKQQVLYGFNDTTLEFPTGKTVHWLFEEQVERTPDSVAVVVGAQGTVPVPMDHVSITYKELNEKSNQVARYLSDGKGIKPGDRVGIWMSQSLYRPVSILGVLKAGAAYVPIDPSLPEERIKYMINDASIGVVISEKKYIKGLNRLQWECRDFHSYLCVDSFDIHGEEEIEPNDLMDRELWHHVGETASDDITGGGWISSYTGEPLSGKEMEEYGNNILKKLASLLHPQMRVLEIGCASGISMYRIAPNVGLYYGTDLSAVIIDKNKKRVEEEGHRNIKLSCLAAHEVDKLEERNFDLVIMNSVIQCFHGHNYLRKVIRQAVELLGEKGYLFIGDIMDQERKSALVSELTVFKQDNKGKSFTTKTDFSSELFVSRGFWTDLAAEWQEIENVEFTEKISTIANELTRFRYDTLMGINKKSPVAKKWVRLKHQDDLRNLAFFGSEVRQLDQSSDSLVYVIYTSGTTGQPKGVMIEHRSLVNLCYWHNRYHKISEADNTTLYAGFGFDASILEIFPHLIRGAALHLVDDAIKLDIEALNAYFERNHISVSYLPTQFCEQFMNYENRSLRVLLTGGDKLRTFVKRSYYLFDNYGPTENTVVTSGYRIEKSFDNIPIGKPVDNNRVYILDREGWQPQPVGVAGELCIGGVGLARGYLNSPELTAERFLSVSYRTYYPKKIYKTGDLARWLMDGNIEFLGRMDYQVKIRGYRIELGEIESRLIAHNDIKEAVVIDRGREKGDSYLCAYIVPAEPVPGGFDSAQMADFLAEKLPDYMIPAYFVQLGEIPMTLSGKVDRKILPDPVVPAVGEYIAPRNRVEKKLVEVWSEILRIDHRIISIDSDFFHMGGHSLNATRLVAKINKEFNLKLPLIKVFEFSRLQDFADYLNRNLSEIEKGGRAAAEIELVEEKEYYDVSPSQKRIWVLSQQEEASLTFNMPSAYSLEGQLDINALRNAFKVLTARHESLRTVFITMNGQPKQKIIPGGNEEFEIHSVDLPGEEPESSKHMQMKQFINSEFRTLFNLSVGPLLRAKLLILTRNRHVFLFTMHHIIGDALSMQVLYREVFLLYNGMKKGVGNPLKSLKIQYKDYTAWQNSRLKEEQLEKLKSYWFKQLSAPLPTLQLPTDHPRPQALTFNGAEFTFTVDEPLTRQLKTIGEQNDATLFMVLLTVFKVLLFRYSGQSDIIVGTVVAGREHADLYDQIGFYLNTLPLRTRFNSEYSFTVLLKKVRLVCLEAYDSQLYSFDQLVSQLGIQRDVSRNPIFDVMVDMINTDTDAAVYNRPAAADNTNLARESDLIIQPLGFDEIKSKYDLTVYIFEGKSTLSFKFEYNRDLFEKTTIRRMAKRLQSLLENVVKNPYSGISDLKVEDVPVFSPIESISPKVEQEAQLLASYHQERLWFIDQFEAGYIYPSSPVYHNIPLLLEINGALNIELLEQSINEVIQRHQALRTRIITMDNRPFQSIRPSVDFHLEVNDALQKPNDQLHETGLKLAVEEIHRPFPLDQDQESLIRGLLIQMVANCKYLLVITVHHIIADRYSLEILAREILLYYEAFSGYNSSLQLEDLSFQYGDFSQWQRAFSDDLVESLLFYWRWKLCGKLQALELPTDRPRAPIHIYQSRWHPFSFTEALNEKINSLVGQKKYLILLAAFKTLLYHYSDQEEIVVGTVMKNRTQSGTEGIIGPIANLVVVRSYLTRGITFNELLSQLNKTVAEAREYQTMPFDRLVLELKPDMDMSRTALFDVLFQYEENPFQLAEVGNLKINAIETNLGWGKYDLNLLIQRNGDRFSGVVVFNREYHNESTISRFIGHFMVLLEEILAEPHRQLSQFNLLTEEEQLQLLTEWNQPQIDYPTDKTIHEIFQEHAVRRPGSVALIGQGAGAQGNLPVPMEYVSISYKELKEKSNQLAYVLRQKGVTTDTVVGMLMERSVEMIIAILGILKAGGAYLPIDPDYPQERIDFILKDSNARILLKESEIAQRPISKSRRDQTNPNDQNKKSMPIVLDFEHLNFEFVSNFEFLTSNLSPLNLAYIIYTSGTTGQPKGCMITHKNVISLLKNKFQPFDFNENDVWTMFHQYNFDFSVWEMYGALLYGGKLIVIPKMVTRDPGQYLEILRQEKVTVLNQTPSAFYQLSTANMSQSNPGMVIRYVIFGGEALNPAKLKQWRAKYLDTKLINMFGITETTIHVTYKEIGDKEIEGGTSNIGRPVSTLNAYVVGRDFNLLPIGIPGELYVGGEGLARGYLNRPELTSKMFINKKFLRGVQGGGFYKKSPPGRRRQKLYKSGDLVKLLENGDMEYLGRIDHQVQIRGFRIELGEIENQLLAHQAIKEVVVMCIEDDRDAGDKTLCACIVSDNGLDAVELRDYLSRRLPGHMVPSLFKQVDYIPLTSNGKVDRKGLQSSGTRLGVGAKYVPPATPTETRIVLIWREILKLDNDEVEIGIHDNFFDIGGTSMDVVRVNARIAEEFNQQIPIVTMYKYTTIRALSGFLDQGESDDHDMVPQEKRVDRIQKGRSDRSKMRDMRKRGRI